MYNFPNTQKYEEHQPKPDCVLKIPMHKEEHRLEHGLSIDLINMDPCLTADLLLIQNTRLTILNDMDTRSTCKQIFCNWSSLHQNMSTGQNKQELQVKY